ncbi:HipA N-terminal domain-containing protein [Nocardia sp. NPDC058666]|uniref:HipA N-terminal domain-containing protein n=1 Tax=unclassified Nocardia TaxID=2637762 RepID=UPI0036697DB0
MADLLVELYDTHIGTLVGTWRNFDFIADSAAVEKFGIDSTILSMSTPLTAIATRPRKDRRQNFFRELLPEGRMLTRLAARPRWQACRTRSSWRIPSTAGTG